VHTRRPKRGGIPRTADRAKKTWWPAAESIAKLSQASQGIAKPGKVVLFCDLGESDERRAMHHCFRLRQTPYPTTESEEAKTVQLHAASKPVVSTVFSRCSWVAS
jgi:hypothetical protein